jgi:hypothetical protein
MKLYGGIDLYSNNSVIALLDKQGQVIYRQHLPNNLTLILTELKPHKRDIAGLVVESTYNWFISYWS